MLVNAMDAYNKSLSRIRITESELDQPIFRFFPFYRLQEMLHDKALVLVKTKLWEDPYENYLLKCVITYNGQDVDLHDLAEQVFGQCWTLAGEDTDALWRIYSHDKQSVRVKTTIRKLQDATYKMGQTYIGKVRYDSEQNVIDYFTSITSSQDILNTKGLLDKFLLKRKAFIHENEIRALYMGDTSSIDLNKITQVFTIDPNSFIEEIVFDPRLEDDKAKDYQNIIAANGYIGPVRQSDLYKLRPSSIKFKT